MEKTKILPIKKEIVFPLIRFAVLLGIAVIAPLLGHKQFITGPIVNAILFISVATIGTRGAVLIAFMPSVIALFTGLIPIALAPMLPFIITGNIILVIIFNCFRKTNYWLGMISASILKFLFLFLVSSTVINLLLKGKIAANAAAMMSWPQLFTALGGGLIAYIILRYIKQSRA